MLLCRSTFAAIVTIVKSVNADNLPNFNSTSAHVWLEVTILNQSGSEQSRVWQRNVFFYRCYNGDDQCKHYTKRHTVYRQPNLVKKSRIRWLKKCNDICIKSCTSGKPAQQRNRGKSRENDVLEQVEENPYHTEVRIWQRKKRNVSKCQKLHRDQGAYKAENHGEVNETFKIHCCGSTVQMSGFMVMSFNEFSDDCKQSTSSFML